MTADKFLTGLLDQAPLLGATAIIVWLSLPQLAERFVIIGKLLKPLSRRWREKAARLAAQQDAAALQKARELAALAMREMTPPDVVKMEERLMRVEDAEDMLRAFVIYDELWHFHDDHNEARRGRKPAHRMAFDTFEEKWKAGWRPFDERGQYTGDLGAGGDLPQDDRSLNQYRDPDE
jgi:hypothetical protein